MKYLNFLFFLFITSCFAVNGQAQDDYAVKQHSDTIFGRLKFSAFGSSIKLKTKDSTYVCAPSDFTALYHANMKETFRSVKREGQLKHEWVELEEDGRIKVYSSNRTSGTAGPGGTGGAQPSSAWFTQKEEGPVIELRDFGAFSLSKESDNGRLLESYFQDSPSIANEYAKLKRVRFKDIIRLIKKYNTAVNPTVRQPE